MPRITEELIRRKAEHHDGLLCDLEELSLHQCEIERIETLGSLTRKLQILYLQNNIIPRIEGLHHLKDLRYLNLALNNITKIEGLSSCEFLNKLDLTVNFVDVDELEASFLHLSALLHLRDLYMMGNPAAEWPGFRSYAVAMLPQVKQIDGKEITRAERIAAMQQLPVLRAELRALADKKREEKGLPPVTHDDGDDEDDTEAWTPEARVRMYKEMAERKEEQEKRKREMEPTKRDYTKEQLTSVEAIRAKERSCDGPPKQCNEGRWEFALDDDDGHGNVVLRLHLSKYLDTSLIDVDVHPLYVSLIIKSKLFRLLWPEEVRPSDGTCQRSQTTGELVITVPKAVARPSLTARRATTASSNPPTSSKASASAGAKQAGTAAAPSTVASTAPSAKPMKLAEEVRCVERRRICVTRHTGNHMVVGVQLLELSRAHSSAAKAQAGLLPDGMGGTMLFRESSTTKHTEPAEGTRAAQARPSSSDFVDDSDVPPLE